MVEVARSRTFPVITVRPQPVVMSLRLERSAKERHLILHFSALRSTSCVEFTRTTVRSWQRNLTPEEQDRWNWDRQRKRETVNTTGNTCFPPTFWPSSVSTLLVSLVNKYAFRRDKWKACYEISLSKTKLSAILSTSRHCQWKVIKQMGLKSTLMIRV